MAVRVAGPPGWVAVQTRIRPGGGNIGAEITNNQAIIAAGLQQGRGARVVIFPEAVLENWLGGTQEQFAQPVPPGQIWLIGAQTTVHDAVVRVKHGYADPVPVAQAAGLLLGGDWQPWNPRTLHPAWWQRVFNLDGQRVWAAVCVEQVQPWTWLEALWQRPTVIVAQANAWWAPPESAAPGIQEASTRAWARLMGVGVVEAVNRPGLGDGRFLGNDEAHEISCVRPPKAGRSTGVLRNVAGALTTEESGGNSP
jgi:hypothetical protein